MFLGPVFNAELVTTARRARYYVIRLVYGLILLFQVYLVYNANSWRLKPGQPMLIDDMAQFGRSIFDSFAYVQMFVMLALTPALVGGTIAEERQRKTLHYLLASQLTGLEIVGGKLAARLLHVGVLVAVGLPVVALIGLFGGVDFELLLAAYAGTISTVYFLACLSILVSVKARRPREAISLLYVLELIWLIGPATVMGVLPSLEAPWPSVAEWVNPVLQWVACTSPLSLGMSIVIRGGMIGSYAPLIEMIASQVIYGTAFVLFAAFRLRPAFRNEGAGGPRPRWMQALSARRRWGTRPPIGKRAMLWKERYVARSTGLTRGVLNLLAVGIIVSVGYWTYTYFRPAAEEMWKLGFFAGGPRRVDLHMFLRVMTGVIYVVWFLGLATASASGITSEREEDTWISLTSTMLEGDEILRAKMFGPAWGLRGLAGLLALLWVLGAGVGAIHPLGLLLCSVELVVFSWFVVALGTIFSLHSRSSTRSLAATMATLIFLNGGYLFCCIPLHVNSALMFSGMMPYLLGASLVGYPDMANSHQGGQDFAAAVILGVFAYGFAALGMTASAMGDFDQAVGRADRLGRGEPPEWVRDRLGARKPPGAVDDLA